MLKAWMPSSYDFLRMAICAFEAHNTKQAQELLALSYKARANEAAQTYARTHF